MELSHLAAYEASTAAVDQQAAEVAVGAWTVVHEIGKGNFGRVVLAQHRVTHELAAIKLLPRGPFVARYATYVAREILHQASLHHPFVVGIKEVILTQRSLAIVMEYASGGNVFEHVKARGQLLEAEARWIFQQLMIGLSYCHDRGVANRDLKLENLLLDRRTTGVAAGGVGAGDWPLLKICDFGYSKHEANSTAKTGVGTPVYMAPEVIGGSSKYSAKKADIWSCGVILYVLLFGGYPFNPEARDHAVAIVSGKWSIPAGTTVSPEAQHLVRQMMAVDPLVRIDMAGILSHPWFLKALPPGAAAMNDLYLTTAPNLEPVIEVITSLVQASEAVGAPEEPHQVVPLVSLGSGAANGQGAVNGSGAGTASCNSVSSGISAVSSSMDLR